MTTALELAQRLVAALQDSGMTRQQLTEQAGVSRQAVYRLLKGDDVQVSTLLSVMEVLKLDLAALPRALGRALPDIAQAPARDAPPAAMAPADPLYSGQRHPLSAVQQRLARVGSVKPKGGA